VKKGKEFCFKMGDHYIILITIFYAFNFQTDYQTLFNPPPKNEWKVTTFFKCYITCSKYDYEELLQLLIETTDADIRK